MQLLCKGFFFLGASSLGLSRPGFTRLMKGVGFSLLSQKIQLKTSQRDKQLSCCWKDVFQSFPSPFSPSCLPTVSLNPARSLLLRWDLEFGTTKFCSLEHRVFPMLQKVSLITPKVEQKSIFAKPLGFSFPPLSVLFFFWLSLNNQYFISISFYKALKQLSVITFT